LTEAHAMEQQTVQLLEKGADIAGEEKISEAR
jgi:hypothetical protein